jgi:hypothetical protein
VVEGLFFSGFLLLWFLLFFGSIGGLILGVVALVSAAQTPTPAFGPWWDNTKTAWLLGIAISYLIPFGLWFTAIYWFRTGKRGLERDGIVGRPFWMGPIKPYPPAPVSWYPPPAYGPGPAWDPGASAHPPPPDAGASNEPQPARPDRS